MSYMKGKQIKDVASAKEDSAEAKEFGKTTRKALKDSICLKATKEVVLQEVLNKAMRFSRACKKASISIPEMGIVLYSDDTQENNARKFYDAFAKVVNEQNDTNLLAGKIEFSYEFVVADVMATTN